MTRRQFVIYPWSPPSRVKQLEACITGEYSLINNNNKLELYNIAQNNINFMLRYIKRPDGFNDLRCVLINSRFITS